MTYFELAAVFIVLIAIYFTCIFLTAFIQKSLDKDLLKEQAEKDRRNKSILEAADILACDELDDIQELRPLEDLQGIKNAKVETKIEWLNDDQKGYLLKGLTPEDLGKIFEDCFKSKKINFFDINKITSTGNSPYCHVEHADGVIYQDYFELFITDEKVFELIRPYLMENKKPF